MAKYYTAASNQLAPGYDQQIGALQGQIPAIQQLYQSLMQGLVGQQAVGNQNILEGASGRGLLRSTIPVQEQVGLGQQILGQQGQYALQQSRDLGDIYSKMAGVNVDKVNAISGLANQLQGNALQGQQFAWQKAQDNRQYKLQKQTANQSYNLQMKAARNF